VAIAESRCLALVMLRSAEADPHVTKRALRTARQAGRFRPRCAAFLGPKASARRAPGTSLQELVEPGKPPGRSRAAHPTPHRSFWRLQRRPLPDAAVNAASMRQLTSGLCSADESVATHRRFQRCIARVSHGLGSPSRSSCIRFCLEPLRTGVLCVPGSRFPVGEPTGPRLRPLHDCE